MRAVLLAGGLGTRLRPYTTIIPKPLVPIADRPILEHIIRRLHDAGTDRIDLCVSHLGELIQLYFTQDGILPEGIALSWHWEDEPLGTAGALRVVPDLDETFIAMNGDVLTTIDFRALCEFHHEQEAVLTIATQAKRVPIDLGVIETDGEKIVGYREKPTLSCDVSMGVYVYEPRALDALPEGRCDFPDLVQRLIDRGERVAAYRNDALWYDIGTPAEYERAISDAELLARVAAPSPPVRNRTLR